MNYPYANGMVKAIEDKILDKNRLARLLKIDKEKFLTLSLIWVMVKLAVLLEN